FAFVFSVAFVGCGEDYDSDIDDLKKADAATLQAAQSAVATAKSELQSQITGVETSAAAKAVVEAKAAALTEVATQLSTLKVGDYSLNEVAQIIGQVEAIGLESLSTTVEELKGLLEDESTIEAIKDAAALKLQVDVLTKYLEGYKEGDPTVKEDIEALKALITEGGELTEEQIDKIAEQLLKKGLGELITLQVEGLITGIQLLKAPSSDNLITKAEDYFTFQTAVGLVDYTFKEGYVNPVAFKKDLVLAEGKQHHVLLKVTPTNATLTPEAISLIDSKTEKGVNEYVKAIKAERYTKLITKAGESGLWDVTFEVTDKYSSATKAAFDALTTTLKADGKKDKNVAFALAVNTGGDRLVLTDFDYVVAVDAVAPVYSTAAVTDNEGDPIQFTVTDISSEEPVITKVADLPNRLTDGNGKESVWEKSTAADNTDPSKNIKNAPSYDARSTKLPFAVSYNKAFEVAYTGSSAFAYYIGLDVDNADDSEKTAWTKAGAIAGIDTIYRVADKAQITIKDAALNSKRVGFRVIAVNANGTLVDPDGRAFYVNVGAIASDVPKLTANPLSFTADIFEYVPVGGSVYSTTVPLDWATLGTKYNIKQADVYGYALKLGGEAKDIVSITGIDDNGNKVVLDYSNSETWTARIDEALAVSDAITASKDKILTSIRISEYSGRLGVFAPVITPSKLKDNTSYSGTLQLLGSDGKPLGEYDVTLKKELPTKFPVKDAAGKVVAYTVAKNVSTNNRVDEGGDYRFYVNPVYYDKTTATKLFVSDGRGEKKDFGGAVVQLSYLFTTPDSNDSNIEFSLTVNKDRVGEKTLPSTRVKLAGIDNTELKVGISDYDDLVNNMNLDYVANIAYNYGYISFGGGEYKLNWNSYNTQRLLVSFNPTQLYTLTLAPATLPTVTSETKAGEKSFYVTGTIQLQHKLTAVKDSETKSVQTASFKKFYDLSKGDKKFEAGYSMTILSTTATVYVLGLQDDKIDPAKLTTAPLWIPGSGVTPHAKILAGTTTITIPTDGIKYENETGLISVKSSALTGTQWGTPIKTFLTVDLAKAGTIDEGGASKLAKGDVQHIALLFKSSTFKISTVIHPSSYELTGADGLPLPVVISKNYDDYEQPAK
ncbi:hypothetical protein EZS27_026409, partial [termite gut metagenome]